MKNKLLTVALLAGCSFMLTQKALASDVSTFNELQIALQNETNINVFKDITATANLATPNNNLTITGNGHFISGSKTFNGLEINGKDINVSNLTLKEFVNDDYSGFSPINNWGKANINNVSFEANRSYDGGGINNWGIADVINSNFNGNSALAGGAIYNGSVNDFGTSGILTVTNTTFENNKATEVDDSFPGLYGGGAIANLGNLSISDSTFKNNSSADAGGAINNNDHGEIDISSSKFENNVSDFGYGGAVANIADGTLNIKDNNIFSGNNAKEQGGAIYNENVMSLGDNNTFDNNTSGWGGAIYTDSTDAIDINKAVFTNNKATERGGAILVDNGDVSITNSTFSGNSADSYGGAAGFRQNGSLKVSNSTFENNKAGVQGGAIIQFMKTQGDLDITNTTFKGNEAAAEGGAVWAGAVANINGSTFINNKTTGTKYSDPPNYNNDDEGGGAVFVGSSSKTTINNSSFINNGSNTVGGAIATRSNAANNGSSALDISNSSFQGNNASVNGGAIASYIDSTINDTSFTNNTAGKNGGAVWSNQNLTINANNSNILFSGNKAAEGGDIYMNKENANLNLNAAKDKTITLAGGVSGNSAGYNMQVNSDPLNTGSIVMQSVINNASINVNNGTFHLAQGSGLNNSTLTMNSGTTLNTINNEITSFGNNLTLNNNVNLAVDVNLGNGTADNFSNAVINNGKITLNQINPIGTTLSNNVTVNLAQALGIDPSALTISSAIQPQTILTPIRYLQGSITSDGMLNYAPTGNSYRDFNPSVMVSPVAAQLGGYLVQLNAYDEAFRNLDMKMLMTREERKAYSEANRYSAVGDAAPQVFSPTYLPEKEAAGWVRPYASFEKVGLQGGPNVSNVMYGSFFGVDSDMYEFENGAQVQYSAYAGYNGSHQAFGGNSIYQNGGTLGATAILYKGDFFTALTANASASSVEASTMYGSEDFPMLMAGVASKTGYNWELAKGKFIIQPNYLMSYTFVNTFNYTNAAGVKITSDPLNAIQIAPGVKFIGNLKNGWQPYASVRMVWNIMDKTDFTAAETSLPELSVKPYVEYGIGVQKRWGERFTGFIQTMIRNGGRNGVAFACGFRIALGKAPNKAGKLVPNNIVKQPASIILNNSNLRFTYHLQP